jgi:hypothetical protein
MADKIVYKIVIDCPPVSMRPDGILNLVLRDTELTSKDFTITSKFFGAWTFVLDETKNDIYDNHKYDIGTILKKLNAQGCVRYAEW